MRAAILIFSYLKFAFSNFHSRLAGVRREPWLHYDRHEHWAVECNAGRVVGRFSEVHNEFGIYRAYPQITPRRFPTQLFD